LTDLLKALWDAGWLVNGVIALTLLEAAALLIHRHLTGSGIEARDWVLNLLSGLSLMMAVRSAVLEQAWPITAAWMSAAGLAHGADLLARWRRHRRKFG
jgi:hypothetical protein